MDFKKLYEMDLNKFAKKIVGNKMTLTYLSWATAWKLLKEADENAKFEQIFNLNPKWDLGEDTFLFRSGTGFMVRTKITFQAES
ncbi:MAG: DUF1071 domain-containing protein, partial [Cetobacterium sp.]